MSLNKTCHRKFSFQAKRNQQISNTSQRCCHRKSDVRTDIPGTSEENQRTVRPCHIHQPWAGSGRPENQRPNQGDH